MASNTPAKNSMGKISEIGFTQVNNYVNTKSPKILFNKNMKRGNQYFSC